MKCTYCVIMLNIVIPKRYLHRRRIFSYRNKKNPIWNIRSREKKEITSPLQPVVRGRLSRIVTRNCEL